MWHDSYYLNVSSICVTYLIHVWHDSYYLNVSSIYVTLLMHIDMFDITHAYWYVWHTSFISGMTRIISMCLRYVWHYSFKRVISPIHMWHDSYHLTMSFICVTYLIHIFDMTHSCVTWLILSQCVFDACDITHAYWYVWHYSYAYWYVWHHTFIRDMTDIILICVTYLIHMCDMTHSCVTWLISSQCVFGACDITHAYWYVWHTSFICDMTDIISMCLWFVWHTSFICVTWPIHVWHDSYHLNVSSVRVTLLMHIDMCNIPHSYVTWLISSQCVFDLCDIPHSYVRHDPFICDMTHIIPMCLRCVWHHSCILICVTLFMQFDMCDITRSWLCSGRTSSKRQFALGGFCLHSRLASPHKTCQLLAYPSLSRSWLCTCSTWERRCVWGFAGKYSSAAECAVTCWCAHSIRR